MRARMCSWKSRSQPTIEDAEKVVATARKRNRKLVLGYILRVHPSWMKFIELGKTLGKPLVMRLNLNQQSNGKAWTWHKNLINSLIPIVDCGVHYVDVMCQLTGAKPVRVHGIGAKLWAEAKKQNYGHLHVTFDDGSVGWYEAGWGPMMSEVAFFVKDVVGPKGAVSIVPAHSDRKDQLARRFRIQPTSIGTPRPISSSITTPRSDPTRISSSATNSFRRRTSPAIRRSAIASRPSS